jgi:hypothetical protein
MPIYNVVLDATHHITSQAVELTAPNTQTHSLHPYNLHKRLPRPHEVLGICPRTLHQHGHPRRNARRGGLVRGAALTVFVAEFEHEVAAGRRLPGLLVFRRVYILVERPREDATVDSLDK